MWCAEHSWPEKERLTTTCDTLGHAAIPTKSLWLAALKNPQVIAKNSSSRPIFVLRIYSRRTIWMSSSFEFTFSAFSWPLNFYAPRIWFLPSLKVTVLDFYGPFCGSTYMYRTAPRPSSSKNLHVRELGIGYFCASLSPRNMSYNFIFSDHFRYVSFVEKIFLSCERLSL